nr:reverse transcriptase domain-containing protein [Tanacetum cinerariifolium]
EVGEDVSRVREYKGVVFGLRIAMRRREERIRELKALGDCEGDDEIVRFIKRMQFDDMDKCNCSLLLIREMEDKAHKKSRLARQINALCDTLTNVIDGRWTFVRELEMLAYKFVPGKMAEFMKEMALFADVPRGLSDSLLLFAAPMIVLWLGGGVTCEIISNKHKIKQISAAFLSDESSAMIQNKVPPKLEDPGSFLIPCNFNKTFSCNASADLSASINLMPYSLYAKLSLETLKLIKMGVRLADRSFQYPVGIAENMLVEVGKFTFPADFVILEMEKDSKKQLNHEVGTERMIFNIDSAMKHSYSNDDTCFSIDVIDEILEEDFDALLDEVSKILHSIEGTLLEE